MNIYIDTNVFLSFYHFTATDLEELRKLAILVKQGEARLLLPEQTRDEFYRNREGKIADAIKKLKEQKLNLQFPAMRKDYTLYDKLRELQKQYAELHADFLDALQDDIEACKLKADELTTKLFGLARPHWSYGPSSPLNGDPHPGTSMPSSGVHTITLTSEQSPRPSGHVSR